MKTTHRSKVYPNDKNRYPVKEVPKTEGITSLPLTEYPPMPYLNADGSVKYAPAITPPTDMIVFEGKPFHGSPQELIDEYNKVVTVDPVETLLKNGDLDEKTE